MWEKTKQKNKQTEKAFVNVLDKKWSSTAICYIYDFDHVTYTICQGMEKCYPQTFLKECKYEIKTKNKMENLVNDDLNPSS